MVRQIIGVVAVTIIGGTTYAVSQKDVTTNFVKNTGMSQTQAQQYVNSIPKSDMASFSDIGQSLVSDGNTVPASVAKIDCANYSYNWETPTLSCDDGIKQLQTLGNDEVTTGHCFEALGTDLGSAAKDKITECITDITSMSSDYDLPIAAVMFDSITMSSTKNTLAYNKSVLQSAVKQ